MVGGTSSCKRPKVTKLAAAEYEHRVNLCFNLFDTFITSKGTKRVGRSCLSLVHKSHTVLSCESTAGFRLHPQQNQYFAGLLQGLGALLGSNLEYGHPHMYLATTATAAHTMSLCGVEV